MELSPIRKRFLCAAALVGVLGGGDARAATFVVNSIADVAGGGNLTDGVCETALGNGICTLRAAIMEANRQPTPATIRVPAGNFDLTLLGAGGSDEAGPLLVTAAMTIRGAGPNVTTIDGNGAMRVLESYGDGVVIESLTIADGHVGAGNAASGVNNHGDLLLENVRVTGHSDSGAVANGEDAVPGTAVLTMRHCEIDHNTALATSAGLLTGADSVTVIEDSSFSQNDSASGNGGAIQNFGDLTIERTTLYDNSAGAPSGQGGGLYVGGGDVRILNSELNGNDAADEGGGIYVLDGSVRIINATIMSNVANYDADGLPGSWGGGIGVEGFGATILVKNSIVSNNASLLGPEVHADDCGPVADVGSGDYNARTNALTCDFQGQTTHNLDFAAPIAVLLWNGGFAPGDTTEPGPLVRAIPNANCTDFDAAALRTDIRGYHRGNDGCDIGAHQSNAVFRHPAPLGAELIRNGGAEGNEFGQASSDRYPAYVGSAPYWVRTAGQVEPVAYGKSGGYPTLADAPAGSGSTFFRGGEYALSVGEQIVDVSALAAQIDAGTLRYRAAGAFGGVASQQDFAQLTVSFYGANFELFDAVEIGGFDAADRGNVTRLLRDAHSGLVPVGTRNVRAVLTMTAVGFGGANNGYADDLSLVLPEPGATLAGGLALATLAAVSRSRRAA